MSLFLSEEMVASTFWGNLERSNMRHQATDEAQSAFAMSKQSEKRFGALTGSISLDDTRKLWLLARYFSPKKIVEIGTYIGRSTMALYMGSSDTIKKIFTCDISHDCWDGKAYDVKDVIEYFGKTASTVMLSKLVADREKIDLFFIDGRLQPEDLTLVRELVSNQTVFIVDDFEGIEKGVENALLLRRQFPHLMLLPPLNDSNDPSVKPSTLALMFDPSIITLRRQQTLPSNM